MNEQVRTLVEAAFAGHPHTQENMDLQEELLCDLNERFEDELASGLSQEQALANVAQALQDMDSLLGARPQQEAPREQDSQVRHQYPGAGLTMVSVSLRHTSLVMEQVVGDQVLIGFEGAQADYALIRHRMEDGVLTIWEEKGDLFTSIARLINFGLGGKLRLGIPKGIIPDCQLKCLSGNIMSNVPMAAGRAESFSGRVLLECQGHVAQRLDAHSKSGSVEVRADARCVDAQTISGRVEVVGWFDQAELNCTSGTARFNGHAQNLNMSQTSGSVKAQGTFSNVDAHCASGSIAITCQTAPQKVNARTISGRIAIGLPASVSCVRLDARVVSGRVKCDFPEGDGPHISAHSTSGSVNVTRD